MAISFDSIAQQCVTVRTLGAVSVGLPCKFNSSSTVTACSDEDNIHGIIAYIDGNYASLIVRGFVTLPYSGTAPTVGHTILIADGTGKVQVGEEGPQYLVTQVNTTAKTVTFLM